ncbi:aminopeptidase P family protein [Helcobacillus massiliensis]|uniref:Xaa-Pro aminopeptidase n=1 Tax=Helcobacillus massiliensis TaxID=521392 RepID=A0A839QQK5_9MICO|nr:aminopeptidase P family protein [Helcobacillus massiliensis]MBB3022773.1 Xaa-Pro aminopeptidase [Helcobacillus massiliensis]MDK7741789.1 aminopeptidase P family protein [Helcobacillus massiliensis]WOO92116.1 aminopeptidase P family protein [Helcobacillus massiliensis]
MSTNEKTRSDDLSKRGDTRSQRPANEAFRAFIAKGWDESVPPAERREVAAFTPARRDALVKALPNTRIVMPAGNFKVRSNDTDYPFRPDTGFAYYSGLGTDEEPDSVFVVEPSAEDPERAEATYFFRPRSGRDTDEFYADSRYGELWVGRRPTLEEVEQQIGVPCRHIDDLRDAIAKDVGGSLNLTVVPNVDQSVQSMVSEIRSQNGLPTGEEEADLHAHTQQTLSEARLVKDQFEIDQMQLAVDLTIRGFEQVVQILPEAKKHHRGERLVETTFARTARADGNGVGYDTIAAAGNHACTLHWIRNNGQVKDGDLILVDAGVEVDSLYTADITRTLPISGTFTPVQRKVYETVLEAADAAFAIAKPGLKFRDLHNEAMKVIAAALEEWGLLPGTAEESLSPEGQFHRRWMVHGTSHHLGMDVHDCAQARREMYLDAELEEGMVFTIEPGLYFMDNDLLVPEEMRGIGVRIEDDILVTADGAVNMSAALARTPDEVEAWMADLL